LNCIASNLVLLSWKYQVYGAIEIHEIAKYLEIIFYMRDMAVGWLGLGGKMCGELWLEQWKLFVYFSLHIIFWKVFCKQLCEFSNSITVGKTHSCTENHTEIWNLKWALKGHWKVEQRKSTLKITLKLIVLYSEI